MKADLFAAILFIAHGIVLIPHSFIANSSGLLTPPDTTAPRAYFPLEAGNMWEYGRSNPPVLRYQVLQDTSIDGQWYFHIIETSIYPNTTVDQAFFLRYDSTSHRIFRRPSPSTEELEWIWTPCRFDAPFGSSVSCGSYGSATVSGGYTGTYILERDGEPDTLHASYKEYTVGTRGVYEYAAGIGLLRWDGIDGDWMLRSATIGGVRYALPGGLPVSTEPAGAPDPSALLQLWPNPVRSGAPVQVAGAMGAAPRLRFEVTDLLGRRVDAGHATQGAAQTRLLLDTTALPAGIYLLRVIGRDREATALFTVIH